MAHLEHPSLPVIAWFNWNTLDHLEYRDLFEIPWLT